jgi:Domain of unknown function (DUF4260)
MPARRHARTIAARQSDEPVGIDQEGETMTAIAGMSHQQSAAPPTLDGQARAWLRIEGLAALAAGALAYATLGGDLIWFLPALLVPDLSAAGYLGGPRVGALAYNAVHNWAFGLAVLGAGVYFAVPGLVLAGVVLIAHVGMDRFAGYGLKLSTGFQDTHLGRKGKPARRSADATAPIVSASA